MSIQTLREQRAAKAKAVTELATKADWNAAIDAPLYDAGMSEIEALDDQIKRIVAVNELAVQNAQTHAIADRADQIGHDTKSVNSKLFAKWLRGGDNALSAEDWTHIRATTSTTTNSQGGYTVQTDVATTVLDALKAYGGMRAVAEVFQTAMGNTINYPMSDGTNETGELVGQNTTATSGDPSFSVAALNVYKFSSKIVAVPFELLMDSQIDVEGFVRTRLVTRLGRITNTKFTIGAGDGSSEPNGIVTAAGTGVTCANATSTVSIVLYDNLIDLVHSVDPAYRALGNCRFMLNDASLRQIRKIKDGQSRPIFNPGYELQIPGGAPDTLLGYPIQVNQDMAVMAASAKSILFGDFSFYKIRDVMDVQMFRFTDSAYTKLGQVGFLAWLRSGGNFVDIGGSVKGLVNAAS